MNLEEELFENTMIYIFFFPFINLFKAENSIIPSYNSYQV